MGSRIGIAIVMGAALSAAVLALVASCTDDSSWEPLGEVSFLSLGEARDAQGIKSGSLEYSIRNIGKSKISGTRFAFRFSTDRRIYHLTVVDENTIQSGAIVYGRTTIAYYEGYETGSLASATLDSAQFE
jgi:hypothetical protein